MASQISPRSERRTTVPRWFVALAVVYGTALTFLAVAFVLGASTHAPHVSAASIIGGFTTWWPLAATAAAVVAIVLVGTGVAAGRHRRTPARQRA